MKYLYGPINSRRLGLSLGINLTPPKTCTFDCVYCQLGKTSIRIIKRSEYIRLSEITEELKEWLNSHKDTVESLGYITISGSGEPTLNSKISDLISFIKGLSGIKVAVITNASLLTDPSVRKDISGADLIIPSLDAATQEVFQKVDRPHGDLKIEEIINGLIALRSQFKGKIWLEVMLVKGINDDIRHIRKLKEIIERINPDKVQLNSPVRTASEAGILPVSEDKLKKIKSIFSSDRVELI